MADLTCRFIIPGGTNSKGGQLQGPGLGPGGPPNMGNRGTLTVVVQWGGTPQSAPPSLMGHHIFSAADPNQVDPSPFLDGANYVCYKPVSAPAANPGNGPVTYTFPTFTYNGQVGGRYELTFVAEMNANTPNVMQWSEDPEFDTSN